MIKLTDISKYYRSNDNVALGLYKINLEFDVGDFVVITGESGGGKSTLLNVVSGSLPYDDGELIFEGGETSWFDETDWENYRKEKIGFVYQDYNLIDSFSSLDNIKAALFILNPKLKEEEAQKKAFSYLEKVGLKEQAKKRAAQLSSGQKQRLAIARALAKETDIIVADEPTGNLDVENSRQIIKLLSELSKDKLVLMVTHNYEEAEPYATRKIRMYNGEVTENIRLKPNRRGEGEQNVKKEVLPWKSPEKKKQQDRLLAGKMLRKIRMSKPHSMVILFVLFLLLYASIYIFYGSFEKNLDYYPSMDRSDSTYINQSRERLCVRKSDGSAMTKEDIETLQQGKHVEFVDLYDTVNDVFYSINDGKDYVFDISTKKFTVVDESKCLRSVSGMSGGDITKGSMAEAYNEIVVSSDDKSLVGKSITMYVSRKHNWEINHSKMEFVVSGITDAGEEGQVYVSEAYAKNLGVIAGRLTDYDFYGIYAGEGNGFSEEDWEMEEILEGGISGINKGTISNPIFVVNEELSGMNINLSVDFFESAYITMDVPPYAKIPQKIYPTSYLFYGPAFEREGIALKIQDVGEEHGTEQGASVIEVSEELFDMIYPDKDSFQASVYITDYAYTDRVMKEFEKEGYNVISVFRAVGTDYNIDKSNEQTFLLFTSLAALVTVFFVGIFLIRLIINGRKKDYSIMLLIGMNRATLDRINLLDIVYHMAAALIGTIIIVNLAKYYNVPYIESAVSYYDILDYLIYIIIVAAMMVLLYHRLKQAKKKTKADI